MYKQPAEYIAHSLSFSPDVTVSLSLFRIWFFTFRTHGNKTWNIFDVCTHSVNLMCVLGHFSALFCLAQSYWLNGGKSNHNGVYLLKPPRENTNKRRKNGKTITSNRIELNWIEPLNMKRSHVILCYAMLCCAEVVVSVIDNWVEASMEWINNRVPKENWNAQFVWFLLGIFGQSLNKHPLVRCFKPTVNVNGGRRSRSRSNKTWNL